MNTYTLYIGSNNVTKLLELDTIESIVSERHEGFTIQQAVGYWLGQKEFTAVVTINDDQVTIMQTIERLKDVLHQDAIGYQVVPELKFA